MFLNLKIIYQILKSNDISQFINNYNDNKNMMDEIIHYIKKNNLLDFIDFSKLDIDIIEKFYNKIGLEYILSNKLITNHIDPNYLDRHIIVNLLKYKGDDFLYDTLYYLTNNRLEYLNYLYMYHNMSKLSLYYGYHYSNSFKYIVDNSLMAMDVEVANIIKNFDIDKFKYVVEKHDPNIDVKARLYRLVNDIDKKLFIIENINEEEHIKLDNIDEFNVIFLLNNKYIIEEFLFMDKLSPEYSRNIDNKIKHVDEMLISSIKTLFSEIDNDRDKFRILKLIKSSNYINGMINRDFDFSDISR